MLLRGEAASHRACSRCAVPAPMGSRRAVPLRGSMPRGERIPVGGEVGPRAVATAVAHGQAGGEHVEGGGEVAGIGRPAALRWHDQWAARLDGLGRCDRNDRSPVRYPDCRAGRPCPLDSWREHLAVAPAAPSHPRAASPSCTCPACSPTCPACSPRGCAPAAGCWPRPPRGWSTGSTAPPGSSRQPRCSPPTPTSPARGSRGWSPPTPTCSPRPAASTRWNGAISTCDEAFLSRSGSTAEGWTQLAAKRRTAARPAQPAAAAVVRRARRGRQPHPGPAAPPNGAAQNTGPAVRRPVANGLTAGQPKRQGVRDAAFPAASSQSGRLVQAQNPAHRTR